MLKSLKYVLPALLVAGVLVVPGLASAQTAGSNTNPFCTFANPQSPTTTELQQCIISLQKILVLLLQQVMALNTGGATATQPSITFSLTPTYIARNQSYTFYGKVSNGAPNSIVYFNLQRPDGSFYLSQYPGETGADYKTDSNGNATIVRGPILIKNEGQNGPWQAWVTVGGKDSNKVSVTVAGSTTTGFCEHAAPPVGCHYIGTDVYPACNATLVCTDKLIPSITVLSPNGGETFTQGGNNLISWSGGQTKVQVGLVASNFDPSNPSLNSILGWISLYGFPNNSTLWDGKKITDLTGAVSWPVIPGSYKILVVSQDAYGNYCTWSSTGIGCNSDTSNAPFNIVAATPTQSSLSASLITSFANPSYTAPMSSAKIASFLLSVPSNSPTGVYVTSISANVDLNSGGSNLQLGNVKLIDDKNIVVGLSIPFGTTYSTVSDSQTLTFSAPTGAFYITPGDTIPLDVYADILSGSAAGTYNSVIDLTAASGVNAKDGTVVNASGVPILGQNVTIASITTQSGAITVTTDSSSPPAGQVVMGSTQNPLAAYRFTETSNVESVKINSLMVLDSVTSVSSVKASFSNLALYNGSTLLGTSGSPISSSQNGGYIYTFSFTTPVVVPQAGSATLVLKGDVASYASGGATDNSGHTFKFYSASAVGASSNSVTNITVSPNVSGNPQTVLRTTLAATAVGLGPTTLRAKTAVDNLGTITFSANPAGSVALNKLTVTFSGTAPNNTNFLNAVDLLDTNGNSVTVSGATASVSAQCNGSSTCAKTWIFGQNQLGGLGVGWGIYAGTSYTFTLRTNNEPVNTWTVGSGVAATLTASINSISDVTFADGLDTAAVANLYLPTTAVPVPINSVSFTSGTVAPSMSVAQMANLLDSMRVTLEAMLKAISGL